MRSLRQHTEQNKMKQNKLIKMKLNKGKHKYLISVV